MNVFILRHGQAVPFAQGDSSRALTDEGRDEVRRVCKESENALANVERIFHSPYLRAVETSEIVELFTKGSRESSPLLTPDGHAKNVIELLFNLRQRFKSVLLVSHQPLVGELVSLMAGVEPGRYPMGTASLVSFSCDPPADACCELNWLRRP